MPVFSRAEIVRRALDEPLLRSAYMQWRRRHFLSREGHGACFGVFDSFAAARAWLPRSPEFDYAALAAEYVDVRCKRIFPYDYPVMWWLARALQSDSSSVLDIGGSVGVHYYAYRRYFDMPDALKWQVVDVPAIVEIGRDLAAKNAATPLSFTQHLDQAIEAASHDVWIAAGSIQYVENGYPGQLLARCARRPKHILLNKIPIYEGEEFVTTQNINEGAFAPLHVYNRTSFIHAIEAQGYTLWDQWEVHERSMYLPGYPQRSVPTFTGLYFVDSTAVGGRTNPLRKSKS